MSHFIRIFLFVFLLGLTGCAAVDQAKRSSQIDSVRKPLTRIEDVRVGMTSEQVAGIMGYHIIIGYERPAESNVETFQPITLKHPYRVEMLQMADHAYEISYFYTQTNNSDALIADDELTPLIFENGKLVGKGWDELFRLKEKGSGQTPVVHVE